MWNEVQELWDLVQQLRMEKERLLQEKATNPPPAAFGSSTGSLAGDSHPALTVPIERLLYISRER